MIPGLHINTIAEIIGGLPYDHFLLAVIIYFVYGITISLDALYSIILNLPDNSSGILPTASQRLAKEGKIGYGIYSYIKGIQRGIFYGIILSPILYIILPLLQIYSQTYMQIILPSIAGVILLSRKNRINNILTFLLAGTIGLIVLKSSSESYIFPMFVGFFTLPMLFIKEKNEKLSIEKEYKRKVSDKKIILFVILTALMYLIPGVASITQIIILGGIIYKLDKDDFIGIMGAINGCNLIFSLMMTIIIGKARTGVAIKLMDIVAMTPTNIVILISLGIIGALATGELILNNIKHIDIIAKNLRRYKMISAVYLIITIYILTGSTGLLVLSLSTLIGIFTIINQTDRVNLMGSIILPTIKYYLKL